MKYTWVGSSLTLGLIVGCGAQDVTPVTHTVVLDTAIVDRVSCTLGTEEVGTAGIEIKPGPDLPVKIICESDQLFEESAFNANEKGITLDARKAKAGKTDSWQLFACVAGMKGADEKSVLCETTPLLGSVSSDRRKLEFVGKLRLPKSPGTYDFRLILLKFGAPMEMDKPLPIERGILRSTIRIRKES